MKIEFELTPEMEKWARAAAHEGFCCEKVCSTQLANAIVAAIPTEDVHQDACRIMGRSAGIYDTWFVHYAMKHLREHGWKVRVGDLMQRHPEGPQRAEIRKDPVLDNEYYFYGDTDAEALARAVVFVAQENQSA